MPEILAVKNGVELPSVMAVEEAKNREGVSENEDSAACLLTLSV